MTIRVGLLVVGLFPMLLAGPASGQSPIIDFSSFVGGGSISYAGGPTDPLVGSNIVIDVVVGTGTPANPGSHVVTQGLLNFTSGPFGGFSGNVYSFGAGGPASFRITGGVPDAGISNATLLTGQLSSVSVDTSSNVIYLFTGDGTDTKHAQLVGFFGLSGSSFAFGPGVIHILPDSPPCSAPPCAFRGTALDADIPNAGSSTSQAIPTLSEWALIVLLTLLVSVGLWTLRRQGPPARST